MFTNLCYKTITSLFITIFLFSYCLQLPNVLQSYRNKLFNFCIDLI